MDADPVTDGGRSRKSNDGGTIRRHILQGETPAYLAFPVNVPEFK
jgi:hypothetical protein